MYVDSGVGCAFGSGVDYEAGVELDGVACAFNVCFHCESNSGFDLGFDLGFTVGVDVNVCVSLLFDVGVDVGFGVDAVFGFGVEY